MPHYLLHQGRLPQDISEFPAGRIRLVWNLEDRLLFPLLSLLRRPHLGDPESTSEILRRSLDLLSIVPKSLRLETSLSTWP